jgi:CRISPR-associated endoribonuclease Cas6
MNAVFLNWLRAADPALSQELHDFEDIKPFTVSPLTEITGNMLPLANQGNLGLSPQKNYRFRITSLDAELSKAILRYFGGGDYPALPPILERRFNIEAITIKQEDNPWAGISSYEELTAAALNEISPGKNGRKFSLLFYSPTTFKSGGRSLPLPLPIQTFSSLLNRWNTFSPIPISNEFLSFVDETVAISGYDIKSELVWLDGSRGGARLVCFRGWCEYTCLSDDLEWVKALDLLTRFAFYSGIGYKTGWGFGQALRLNPAARSRRPD